MSSSAQLRARDLEVCELVDALAQLQDRLVAPSDLDDDGRSQRLRVACRDVIGQAKGLVLERYMVGVEESVASTGVLSVARGTSAVSLAITGTNPEAAA